MESDIIIVNHHLFFADLSIKQASEYAPDAGILPEAGAVIFDEAHELEDVAGSYFGVAVSNLRVEELVRDVEISLTRNKLLSSSLTGRLKEPARPVAACSSRCCRQGMAGFRSITGASFSRRTGTNFLPCSNRSSGWARSCKIFPARRKRSSRFRGGLGNYKCSWDF